ncbi:hypothetical protein [Vibrio renipiscarius]|uniref:Uncharacterized protein n=1 Tax=Vibrio renipiscarius TaxID=1461322 RepID=A0A0C2JDF4_9VIBR|nr:hypothetical protein [Vibrio renipiscarius]KII75969.1 hypothetical protein OJ16_14125 [Vibrio renipiscarius]KII79073.1 hypothetical protein PL18_09585 [Vibrio renipiscarius]
MDNPKYYVAALLAALMLLLALLLLRSNNNSQVTHVPIIESTLTQSLDGQRRFLTLDMGKGQTHVLSAPTSAQCSPRSQAQIEQTTDLFGRTRYHFISCQ